MKLISMAVEVNDKELGMDMLNELQKTFEHHLVALDTTGDGDKTFRQYPP